jgi:uncharacterized protein YbjT (DUF2867 family)
MNERFLVLGATGLVGSLVLQQLLHDGRDARGATRRPGTRRHVRLDLLAPDTFGPALRDVSTVMLMSRPGDEDAHLVAEPFIRAMAHAGVRRVVVLSALGAQKRPEFALRKVELLVERSGLRWTHVRPNFFMQVLALPPLAAEISARGTLSLPLDDATIAYVDARDVAAVVHRALVDAGLTGRALDVNGPQALDHDRIVQVLARVTGVPVRYVRLGEAEARATMLSRGFSCSRVERVLAFHRLIREGFCSTTDGAVADLLGRPLRRWEEFAAANRSAWIRREG